MWTGSESQTGHVSACSGADGPVVTWEPVLGQLWPLLSVSTDCCHKGMGALVASLVTLRREMQTFVLYFLMFPY